MNKIKSNLWWGPPEDFADRKNERKISWLELFYDLVYVAAIGQITQHIAVNPTWSTVSYSLLLFSLIFWSWVNGSQYYDLHGSEGIRTRVLTFWQMLSVAAVAITLESAFEGRHQGFAISFASIQILITYLWWSVGFFDPSHRVFSKFYTTNYLIAFVLLIASVFTSRATSTLLWILVLILDLTPPLTAARTVVTELKKHGQVFTASATIVERFGLFTIIVLAECILSTVTGISGIKEKDPAVWIAFLPAILISFLLWSLYFDMTSEQETKLGYSYMEWLIFLHFPLLASLSIVGACIKVLLASPEAPIPIFVRWIFCIALSSILWLIVGITRIMKEDEEDRSYIRPVSGVLVLTGLVIAFIPLLGGLNTIRLLGLICLTLLIPVVVGVRSWVKYKFFGAR
jgi:low temperature requirement protein LtrA